MLTPSSIMLGECTQSFQCTSSNILNILFSNSTGNIFPGSWTAFCPAFFIYGNSPGPIQITTKKMTTKTTTKPTTKPTTKTNTTSIKITTSTKVTNSTTSTKFAG
jgi:hypothetical protein